MFDEKIWKDGEYLARKHLIKQGYKIVETNAKLAHVEVDIVAVCPKKILLKELKIEFKAGKLLKMSYLAAKKNLQSTLVFVEVKARSNQNFGNPAEAVTPAKQNRIRRFAEVFANKKEYAGMPIRFDIVSVLDGKVEHIKNAF